MSDSVKHTPHNRHPKGDDPFEKYTRLERHQLAMGDLTDDALANAVYLHGNAVPRLQDVMSGEAKMPIVYLTAAKERIRWLSRRNLLLEQQLAEAQAALAEKNRYVQIDGAVSEHGSANGELKNIILKQLSHTPAKEISVSKPLQDAIKNGGGIPRGSFYMIAAITPPEKSRLLIIEGSYDTTEKAPDGGEGQGS